MADLKHLIKSRWKWLAASALVLMVIIGALIFPQETYDIQRYKALADQDAALCMTELNRALAKNPDWHEGRDLLMTLQFRSRAFAPAVKNMVELARAGRCTFQAETILTRNWNSDVRATLEAAFDPHWHWPRLTYFNIALYCRDYPAALQMLMSLADLKFDVEPLKQQFIARLLEHTSIYIDQIMEVLNQSTSPWAKVFALELADAIYYINPHHIYPAYIQLKSIESQHPLLEKMYQSAIHRSPSLAWRLASERSDEEYLSRIIRQLYMYDWGLRELTLVELGEFRHGELALLRSAYSPDAPAAFLTHELDYTPIFREQYAKLKLEYFYRNQDQLAAQYLTHIQFEDLLEFRGQHQDNWFPYSLKVASLLPGTSTQRQKYQDQLYIYCFEWYFPYRPQVIPTRIIQAVEPWKVWNLLTSWLDYHGPEILPTAENLVSYLAGQPGWAANVSYLQAAVKAKPGQAQQKIPLSEFPGYAYRQESICPNQKYLLYLSDEGNMGRRLYLFNLETKKVASLGQENEFPEVFWSPGSKYMACKQNYQLQVISLDTNQRYNVDDLGGYGGVMGWTDDETLLYYRIAANHMFQVYRYSPLLNSAEKLGQPAAGTPTLTPSGQVVWVAVGETDLVVKDKRFPILDEGSTVTELSWNPDGDKLVVGFYKPGINGIHYAILDMTTGKAVTVPVLRFTPVTWMDQHRVFGNYLVSHRADDYSSRQPLSQVAILDTRTFTLTFPGIQGQVSGRGAGGAVGDHYFLWKLR